MKICVICSEIPLTLSLQQPAMTEKEIIDSVLAGNRNDFTRLVEKYQGMVFRTCMGFIHREDDANEVTQDVFVNAWQNLPSFRRQSAFSTWIYRIAVNASLNFVRKKKKGFFRINLSGMDHSSAETLILPADTGNPEQLMIDDEQRRLVQQKLDELPDKQRTAFVLSKYDDLSQKEIAAIMNISEGAVESLLQRAKANLQKKLASFYPPLHSASVDKKNYDRP